MSSDTLPGLPTRSRFSTCGPRAQPTGQGGSRIPQGPDGAMIENACRSSGALQPRAHVSRAPAMRDQYTTHLGAKPAPVPVPARPSHGRGRLSHTALRAPPTWPSFAKTGFVRSGRGRLFDDISISIRRGQAAVSWSTRGHIVDHWALSVPDLASTVGRLKSEGIRVLEEIHPWGNTRAAMIEGPDRIAIEPREVNRGPSGAGRPGEFPSGFRRACPSPPDPPSTRPYRSGRLPACRSTPQTVSCRCRPTSPP